MPKVRKIKRTFRFHVKVKGAKKEFQKGLGVGSLGYIDVTYNLLPAQYESTIFAMALLDKRKEILDEFVEVQCEEIKE